MKRKVKLIGVVAVVAFIAAAGYMLGVYSEQTGTSVSLTQEAQAKPDNVDGVNVPSGRIPQEIKDNKYPRTYFPNTERLAKDEMRITALGTGMPNQSPSNVAFSV